MTLDERLLAKIELLELQLQEVKRMAKLNVEKEWYSTQEAATLLDITPKTAANYCQNGTFNKVRKHNKRWQIHQSSILNHNS